MSFVVRIATEDSSSTVFFFALRAGSSARFDRPGLGAKARTVPSISHSVPGCVHYPDAYYLFAPLAIVFGVLRANARK